MPSHTDRSASRNEDVRTDANDDARTDARAVAESAERAAAEPDARSTTPPSLAAVCCEGADVLALFDVSTGTLAGTIAVGSHPVHATVCRGRVFVATMGERSVAAVDLDGTVTRIGTGVLGPSHFAAFGDRLFVPCTAGDALAVVNAVELTLERRLGVGAEPHDVETYRGRAFVGSRADGTVAVVDAAALERIATVTVAADARVQGIGVHAPSGIVLAVDQRNATVSAFASEDPDAGVSVRRAVGDDPYELAIDGDQVYVPARADGTVHAFDVAAGRAPDGRLVPETVHEGFETPVDVVGLGDAAWVVDRGRAALRSLGGRTIDTPAPAIEATRIGARVLLSHYDDAAVSLVDPDEGVVWTSDAPSHPFGILAV